MTQLLGAYNISESAIFRLAVICHGMDVALPTLQMMYPRMSDGEKLNQFEQLITENLLQLSIMVRAMLDKTGKDYCGANISASGLIDFSKRDKKLKDISLRTWCNKIIHADTIVRHLQDDEYYSNAKSTFELRGSHVRDGEWYIGLSVELFCLGILEWLDTLEDH